MLSVAGAVIGGAQFASSSQWAWGGIPVIYIAGLFCIGGMALAIVGFVKKV